MGKMGRPRHPDILTPREWEVLALLRERLTNEEIAQRLGISLDGAKYHVSQILSKLGVATREEAAAWRPEAPPAERRERRAWWARWPLWVKVAGAAMVTTAVAGMALVAYDPLRSDDEAGLDAEQVSLQAVVESPICGIALAPDEKAGPLKMRFGLGSFCWTDVENENSYKIEGTVRYLVGGCDAPTDVLGDEIPFSAVLPANSTRFSLPTPRDPRLTFLHALTVTVIALDSSGATLLTDGAAIQRDDFCQPSPTP